MSRRQEVWCLLALVITVCHAGQRTIKINGNDDGCNGVPHGISCCEEDFVVGDNAGDEEIFIQADQYIFSCILTCKSFYPNSVGITESRRQQYSSGPGRNENKCWCEFGRGKLESKNLGYKTCMFSKRYGNGNIGDENESENEEETVEELLARSFTAPIEACVYGHTSDATGKATLDECKGFCLVEELHQNRFRCNSIEYFEEDDRYCSLSNETKATRPEDYQEPCSGRYTTMLYLERIQELSKSEVSSPSNVSAASEAGAPPKYLMVVTSCSAVPAGTKHHYYKEYEVMLTKCEADEVQGQKMGRYTLQPESYNNFSVWKKEHLKPEQYLFMSDNHHWVIGPDVNTNLFGVISEDRPAPEFPNMAAAWRFWDGHDWKEDNITVMAGEKKDVGEDREIIMLDFKTIDVDNVNDSSHCCRACKGQDVVTDKGRSTPMTVMVNFDKRKKQCSCFNALSYGFNFDVQSIVLTRYNSEITSGLCDTYQEWENNRRSGQYEHSPTYHYSDVQGPLGEGYRFELDNLEPLGSIYLDRTESPLHHSSCCKECRKKYNDTEIFTYIGKKSEFSSLIQCRCSKVRESGTRPVTQSTASEYYSGICEDIGPPVDCEVERYGWDHWTECTNLRKTCGRGFQSRYALYYQVARRGGKPCEEMEQVQSCEVEKCPPA